MSLIDKASLPRFDPADLFLAEDLQNVLSMDQSPRPVPINQENTTPSRPPTPVFNSKDAQTALDASEFFYKRKNVDEVSHKSSTSPISSFSTSGTRNNIQSINNLASHELSSDSYEIVNKPALNQESSLQVPTDSKNVPSIPPNSENDNLITSVINKRNSNLYTIENLAQMDPNNLDTPFIPSLEKSIKNAILLSKYLESFEKNVEYQARVIASRSKSFRKNSQPKVLFSRKTSDKLSLPTSTTNLQGERSTQTAERPESNKTGPNHYPNKKQLLVLEQKSENNTINSIISNYEISSPAQAHEFNLRPIKYNTNTNRGSVLYQDMSASSKTTKIFANALLKAGLSSIALGVAHTAMKLGSNDDLMDLESRFYQKTSITSIDFEDIADTKNKSPLNSKAVVNMELANLKMLDDQESSSRQLAVTEIRAKRLQYIDYIDPFGFLTFTSEDPNSSNKPGKNKEKENVNTKNKESAANQEALDILKGSKKDIEGWDLILSSFGSQDIRKSQKFQSLAKQGLPNAIRPQIYWSFLNIQEVYGEILNGTSFYDEFNRFCEAECDSVLAEVIERDLPRSFPNHAYFYDESCKGIEKLRRVLQAYVGYNPEVGYCQGMNQIAGVLLILGMPEVETFWSLAALLDSYMLDYFTPTLSQLRIHAAVFDLLLKDHNKKLSAHLQDAGCESLMYVTPWFMTVFTMSLPWQSALRVWDWFIFRGNKVLFRIALGIMDICSKELLKSCPTIDKQLGILLHLPEDWVTPEKLISAANKIKLTTSQIEKKTEIVIKQLSSQLR